MSNTPKRKSKAGTRSASSRSRAATPQKAPTNWPRILGIGGGVAAVVVILAAVFFGGGDEDLSDEPIEGVEFFTVSERDHVEGDVDYDVPVPPGGIHNPVWQNCGFYDSEIRTENALHALEHGAVWITYRRDLGEDAIGSLRGLSRNRTQLLISEVPAMDVPLMATAWGVQLELDSYDDETLRRFIRDFTDGPFAPEANAGCTGGVGVPA